MTHQLPHVVIVGGGFAGLAAAKALRKTPAKVVLIDRTNHYLFQPLLYQVATSELTAGQIATPIRNILRNQKNTTVIMGEVTAVDKDRNCVISSDADRQNVSIAYDYLILATGASHSYFGHRFCGVRAGFEESRRRGGRPKQDLAGIRIGRSRGRPKPPSGPADFHSRWRRSHWRGNGSRSRYFRPKHTEIRFSENRSGLRKNCAHRYGIKGLAPVFRESFQSREATAREVGRRSSARTQR